MIIAHELALGHDRLRTLIAFAVREGWQVRRMRDGRIKFTKPGCAAIYRGAATRNCHDECATHIVRGNSHG